VTAQHVCVPGYAKKVRAVPTRLKRQAYAEYGITQYKTGDYEVDHLIPLSLGGSNSIRNLWPQSTKTSPWNSYVEDALERKLHKRDADLKILCSIPLTEYFPFRQTTPFYRLSLRCVFFKADSPVGGNSRTPVTSAGCDALKSRAFEIVRD
jgi:hypothetical protein